MEEYLIHGLMGAGAGLLIAAAGYLKVLSKDGETFDVKKAALSVGVGAVAGFVISTGMLDFEGLMLLLSMAGLSHYGETTTKMVWNFLSGVTGSKKK